jgi:hypothetical protein
MCGLVGLFGNNLISNDLAAFEQMLITSSLRGPHSTGVGIAINTKKKGPFISYYKSAENPYSLIQKKEFQDWFNPKKNKAIAFLGHNRYATVGRIIGANAHPFMHKNILLTHNGSIWNAKELTKNLVASEKDYKDFDVDSEHATFLMAHRGAGFSIPKFTGGFAISWFDVKHETMNLVRNSQKPLWIACHKFRDAFYYASERDMLLWLLKRNNIDIGEVFEPDAGEVITWKKSEHKKLAHSKLQLHTYQSPNPIFPNHNQHMYDDEFDVCGLGGRLPLVDTRTDKGPELLEDDDEPTPEGSKSNEFRRPIWTPPARSSRISDPDAKKGEEFLDSWGLKVGDRVILWVDSFKKYQPGITKYGHASGYFCDKDSPGTEEVEITINTIEEREFGDNKGCFQDDTYVATIQSCCWNPQKKYFDLFCNSLEIGIKEHMDKAVALKRRVSKREDQGPAQAAPSATESSGPKVPAEGGITSSEPPKTNQKTTTTTPTAESSAGQESTKHERKVKAYRGKEVSISEWNWLTRHDCSSCGSTLLPAMANDMEWADMMTPFCPACSKERRNKQHLKLVGGSGQSVKSSKKWEKTLSLKRNRIHESEKVVPINQGKGGKAEKVDPFSVKPEVTIH